METPVAELQSIVQLASQQQSCVSVWQVCVGVEQKGLNERDGTQRVKQMRWSHKGMEL